MMKNRVLAALALGLVAAFLNAEEPDGLTLPKGFHATVVAEGLGPTVRHIAVRSNGDMFISQRHSRTGPGGILAVRFGPDGKPAQTERFSTIDGGTGLRLHNGALYAATGSTVYRIPLDATALVPSAEPVAIVTGLAPGNHAIAFDDAGSMYVSLGGGGNACFDPKVPKGQTPVGLKPCPALETKAGIWKFDAEKPGQTFAEGQRFATGVRDMSALDFRTGDALYGGTHGRDATHIAFPALVSEADDDAIPDEVFRITKDSDLGWPYTYWDAVRNIRLEAPEYGGDNKTPVIGTYAAPIAAFSKPRRQGLIDLAFYNGKQFPKMYRGGMFVVLHGGADEGGARGQAGYNVAFIPFKGKTAGEAVVFAENFAGPSPADKDAKRAAYRPVGIAVAPDGSLYIADSNKGRIWHITYTGK